MNKQNLQLLVLLSGLVFQSGQALSAPVNPAAIPTAPDLSQSYISNRYAEIQNELTTNPDLASTNVVFVGDSITQFWANEGATVWNQHFNDPTNPLYSLNLGVAGDRTEHVLHRLQSTADGGAGHLDDPSLNPSAIVLMLGINNTFFHTNEQIIEGIQTVVETLAAKEPQADIILSSILPHWQSTRNQNQIIPINEALADYVNGATAPGGLTFLETYSSFVNPDGSQIWQQFTDGIHLNASGYDEYSSILLPEINGIVTAAVPIPGAALLFGSAILGFLGVRSRSHKRS